MTTLSPDTRPKAEQVQLEILRRMPAWKKVAVWGDLNETVRSLAIEGIRQRYPQATPEQVRRLYAELALGAELAEKVYGHTE